MGNHYDPLYTHKNSFLPMLCSRPSIKDVYLPQPELRSESFAGDPLSPRITCIGQVKKRSKSKSFFNQATMNNNVRYHKLKKLFSAKNLTAAAPFSAAVQLRRQRVGDSGGLTKKGLGSEKYGCPDVVDLDMDPPLPVVKKVKNGEGIESLWKRRSGGAALRSLELQQIHHSRPHLHLQPTSTLITRNTQGTKQKYTGSKYMYIF